MIMTILAPRVPRLFVGELGDGSLSNRLVGQIAAILYLLSGIVTMLSPFLPTPAGMNRDSVMAVGLAAVVFAGIVWRILLAQLGC